MHKDEPLNCFANIEDKTEKKATIKKNLQQSKVGQVLGNVK